MPRTEPVPKLPSTAQKLSHLAAFSTSHQTTHPDADTQTTCVRNAVRLGNQYQYFNLITCTDGPFSATHLFYLFNSFDYFLLMAWIYPFLPFWNFRALQWRPACAGRHDYEGRGANCFAFTHHYLPSPCGHLFRADGPAPCVIINVDSRSLPIQVVDYFCCYLTAIGSSYNYWSVFPFVPRTSLPSTWEPHWSPFSN